MAGPMDSRARRAPFVVASFAVVALAACGGSSASELFGGGGGGTNDAGGGFDATAPDAGPIPLPDGSPLVDAAIDSPIKRDAGKDGGDQDPGIRCGTGGTFCTVGSQVCCRGGGVPNDTFTCVASAGCNAVNQMPIPCDDEADCTTLGEKGKVCCATVDQFTSRATDVSCKSSGDCSPNNSSYILCDPRNTGTCVNGGTCRLSSQTLPGFYLCF